MLTPSLPKVTFESSARSRNGTTTNSSGLSVPLLYGLSAETVVDHLEPDDRFEMSETQTVGDQSSKRSIFDDIFLVSDDGPLSNSRPTTMTDVPAVIARKPPGAKIWIFTRLFLLIVLLVLPFVLYELKELKKVWYTPILGILAAVLPSGMCPNGGVPFAGGIVFYPVLTAFSDLSTKEVVQFSAASQLFGVGIFGPLNWFFKKPEVFMPPIIMLNLLAGGITIFISWIFLRDVPSYATDIVFTFFAACVAMYVSYGLIADSIHTQSDKIYYNKRMVISLIISAIFGGMLVFLIGIGIETTTFITLTTVQHGDARDAAVTSITIVGLLSAAFVCLSGIPPGPRLYWIAGLPGILIGSTIGRYLNHLIGKKKIMVIFLSLLLIEIIKNLFILISALKS